VLSVARYRPSSNRVVRRDTVVRKRRITVVQRLNPFPLTHSLGGTPARFRSRDSKRRRSKENTRSADTRARPVPVGIFQRPDRDKYHRRSLSFRYGRTVPPVRFAWSFYRPSRVHAWRYSTRVPYDGTLVRAGHIFVRDPTVRRLTDTVSTNNSLNKSNLSTERPRVFYP